MTEEQRRREIDAILKLVNELEALSNYQIAKAHMIRAALEDLRGSSKQVEAVEGGGESLARGGQLIGEGADAHARGVGGAALVEAVAVDQQEERLGLRSDAG